MADSNAGAAGATGAGGSGTAGGQGGAGTAAGGAGGSGSAGTGAATDWTSDFAPEVKGYIQNKGFKNASDLAHSYQNLEKLHSAGPDKLVRVPDDLSAPESRQFWERVGTPKDVKDYGLQVTKENGGEKLAEWAAAEFHKAGVPKGMAQKFMNSWNEKSAANLAEMKAQREGVIKTADANLRTEWGAAYDKNKNLVEQTATALGFTPEESQALGQILGPEKAPKLLLKLASGTSEQDFIAGRKQTDDSMTPDAAGSKVRELMTNADFVQRLNSGDQAAMREWQRVHEMGNPGMQSFT